MAKQTINIGAAPNDGTGTPLRTSFDYCNQNFTELYTATGPSGNNIVVPGSATITGDLTVATDALKVNSSTKDICIGTTTPTFNNKLTVVGGAGGDAFITSGNGTRTGYIGTDGTNVIMGAYSNHPLRIHVNDYPQMEVAALGVFNWYDGAGGTRMTLNSTGLGVGVSPNDKLTVLADNYLSFQTSTLTFNSGRVGRIGAVSAGSGNGYLVFETYKGGSGGGERMRIDSDGNVGVSVTPSAWASNYRGIQMRESYAAIFSDNGNGVCEITTNAYNDGAWKYFNAVKAARYQLDAVGGQHKWYTAGTGTVGGTITDFATAKMTLDGSGNLLAGTTSNSPAGTQSQFVNQWSGGVKWGSTFNQTVSSATSYTHIAFCTNGTVRGSIDANNTTITYGTVSDYRLKENVQPISNALTRIAALKPSTYKWKDSGTDGEGFIAHELASVVPLAVIGQKDALNEDGTIKAQQIDLSKVVPVLVAAIQELSAEVNALKKA